MSVCASFQFGFEGGMWDLILLISNQCLYFYIEITTVHLYCFKCPPHFIYKISVFFYDSNICCYMTCIWECSNADLTRKRKKKNVKLRRESKNACFHMYTSETNKLYITFVIQPNRQRLLCVFYICDYI